MSIWSLYNHKEQLCTKCKKVHTFERDGVCVICRIDERIKVKEGK